MTGKRHEYIGVKEVCEMTGLTRWFVYGLVSDRLIPPPNIYGRVKRWRKDRIEQWIADCEWKPGQDLGQAIINGDKPFVSGACRKAVRERFEIEAVYAETLIRQKVEDGYRRGWRDGRKALAAKMEGDPYFSMESALCEAAPSLFGTDYAYFADIGMDGGGGSPPDFD